MANILGEAWVEVRAPLAGLSRDLSRMQGAVDRSAGVMQTRMGRMGAAMSSLGSKMTLGVTLPLIGYLGMAVKAAADTEKATHELNTALRTTGTYSTETGKDLNAYARQLQGMTVYSDEAIKSAMALAIHLKGNTTNIKEVAKAGIGLATVFKLDLDRGMRIAALGSQGIAMRLRLLGIAVKRNASDTEIWAQVSKKGAEGFVAAMAESQTTEGQLAQLKNTIQDMNASIGKGLIPTLRELVKELKKIADFIDRMPKGKVGTGIAVGLGIGPALLGIGKLILAWKAWKMISGIGKVGGAAGEALAGGAAGGLASKVPGITRLLYPTLAARALAMAGALAPAAGIALPVAGAGALGVVSGYQGMQRAYRGKGMGWNPLSYPGYAVEKWGNARMAGETTAVQGRYPGYVRGAVRMQEANMGGLTKDQGDKIIKELQNIKKKTGTWG